MTCLNAPRPTARWAGALLLGAVLASGVLAQSEEYREGPVPSPPGTVLSDAEPLPAEDRDSPGAIVLPGSPVRARRADAPPDDTGSGVRAIGRNITQILGGPPAEPAATDPPPPAERPQQ